MGIFVGGRDGVAEGCGRDGGLSDARVGWWCESRLDSFPFFPFRFTNVPICFNKAGYKAELSRAIGQGQ